MTVQLKLDTTNDTRSIRLQAAERDVTVLSFNPRNR